MNSEITQSATQINRSPTQDVFELTLARSVLSEDFAGGAHPTLVHLWWRAPNQGTRLVQIYLDDTHLDTTADPTIRDAWITLDRTQPHRIELLAVDPNDAWTAMPLCLKTYQPRLRDTLTRHIIRDEQLPIDTRIDITLDNQKDRLTELFPGDQSRGGFGAIFASGGFGTDNATGPGLGRGQLGFGPLGSDANAAPYRSPTLDPTSTHSLFIDLTDTLDRSLITPAPAETIALDPLPPEPTNLQISPDLTLTWESNDA